MRDPLRFPLRSRYKLDILRQLLGRLRGARALTACRKASGAACSARSIAQAAARARPVHGNRTFRPRTSRASCARTSTACSIARRTTASCTSASCASSRTATRRRSSRRCALYSQQPTGVFHALPISRGKSILQSHWIQDMIQFYGLGVFLAENLGDVGRPRLAARADRTASSARRSWRRARSVRSARTGSPTARRRPTRSSCRR